MSAYYGEAVENYELTMRFAIQQWGESQFNWVAQNGDESGELFESVEDAIRDIRRHYA